MKFFTVAGLFVAAAMALPTGSDSSNLYYTGDVSPSPEGPSGSDNYGGPSGPGDNKDKDEDEAYPHPPANGGDNGSYPGNGGDGNHPGDGNQPGGGNNGGNGNQPGGGNNGGNGNQPGGGNNGGNGNQPGGGNNGGNGNQPGGGNGGSGGNYNPCPGTLYSTPQCCATDVLGVASLDCDNPHATPSNADDFSDICGNARPLCCVLPLLGQGVLCQPPVGV